MGFYTIANHAIAVSAISALQLGSLPKTIPCIRLIMLEIHADDAKKGYGSQLMNHAFDVIKMSVQNVGCYGLYLNADAGAVAFYQKLGFVLLEGFVAQTPRQ